MKNKIVKSTKKKMPFETKLFIFCGLIFPIANFILFYITPNASAFSMAFHDRNGNWGFDNFIRFFNELTTQGSEFQLALRNTLIAWTIGIVAFPFQILTSYFLYKKIPFAGLYRLLFFIPGILAGMITVMVVQYMMSPTGFLAEWIGRISGLDYAPELFADSRFANKMLWIYGLWLGVPGGMMIWLGNFTRIPPELLESGELDGTNWFTEFTKIILPMVWPTIALELVMKTCGILSASTAAFLFTRGDYGTMTLSVWLTLQLYNFSGNAYTSNVYNYMSAVGFCMTFVSVLLGIVVRKYCSKAFTEVEY